MEKDMIQRYRLAFEEAARREQDVEFWFARDLQVLFDYSLSHGDSKGYGGL